MQYMKLVSFKLNRFLQPVIEIILESHHCCLKGAWAALMTLEEKHQARMMAFVSPDL